MRVVCLSDTHDMFGDLYVPDGDVLLHGGDLSRRGTVEEVAASAAWLRSLPHRHKVVIAGNHDFCLETEDPRRLLAGLTYLQDEAILLDGLRIYGSPWTPAHNVWAFQHARGRAMRREWAKIPPDTQLLLTHGPPATILDQTVFGEHVGCAELLARVQEVTPLLHVFGHVHEGHGTFQSGATQFANVCNCALGYKDVQPALTFDWDGKRLHLVPQEGPASLSARRGRGTVMPGPEIWEDLHNRYGEPRELRYLPSDQQQQELALGHVFWLEVVSDGFGGGEVLFYPAGREDDLLDRGPDPQHRRWAFSLGVPFRPEWQDQLGSNPWERYSEVPYLPR